ncbi:MAG: hypothetical protein GKR95_06420 [Gammaproteobacteria bacterium]|nr:hypothetical protein [Gammaproteobacteria bacterium]
MYSMTIPISRRLEFSEIPVVDLAPLVQGESHNPTIKSLEHGAREVGFFYIRNHGIDFDLVAKLHNQAILFFQQSMEEKKKILIDHRIRGYLPLGYQSYEGERREGTSYQEGFWIGHETPVNDVHLLEGPNQWLKHPPELKSIMESYFVAVERVSRILQIAFAQALGLEPGFFDRMFDRPTSRLKLNHYPPQYAAKNENKIGVVPHSDSGAFTILWQDDHGGLEIQNKNGEWVGALPMPDTFVVNLGNIMQYWSNGRFSSTPHRVINRAGTDRYSIPLFVNPNHEVIIEPLVDLENKTFTPFVYGEYQRELWRRTFPVAKMRNI